MLINKYLIWGIEIIAILGVGFVIWRKGLEEGLAEEDIFEVLLKMFLFGGVGGWLLGLEGFLIGVLLAMGGRWHLMEAAGKPVLAGLMAQTLIDWLKGGGVGKETSLPWAMQFNDWLGWRHPVWIYQLLVLVLIFLLIGWIEKEYRLWRWYQSRRGDVQVGLTTAVILIMVEGSRFGLGWLEEGARFGWLKLLMVIWGILIIVMKSGWHSKIENETISQIKDRWLNFKLNWVSFRRRRKRRIR